MSKKNTKVVMYNTADPNSWDVTEPQETGNAKAPVAWIRNADGSTPVVQMAGNASEALNAPFGASKYTPETPGRKNLPLSMNDAQALWVESVDEWIVNFMVKNKQVYFPKLKKDAEQSIRSNYSPLMRPPPPDTAYRPKFHTKMDDNIRVLLYDTEKNELKPGKEENIEKGSDLMPQIHIQGVWFQSRMWGVTAVCKDTLVIQVTEDESASGFIFPNMEVQPVINRETQQTSEQTEEVADSTPNNELNSLATPTTSSNVAQISSMFEKGRKTKLPASTPNDLLSRLQEKGSLSTTTSDQPASKRIKTSD